MFWGGIGAGAGSVTFLNDAKSGSNVFYTLFDGDPVAVMTFSDNSILEGTLENRGGQVDFFDTASALMGVSCFGGDNGPPGIAVFHDHSVSNGAFPTFGFDGGAPGVVYFNDDCICDDGYFHPQGGIIDLSGHNPPRVGCAGLLGYGVIYLGSNNLVVGKASTDDIYLGTIVDGGSNGGSGGSLTKIGTGTQRLQGASTYAGGTTIKEGTLLITTQPGSGTGLAK